MNRSICTAVSSQKLSVITDHDVSQYLTWLSSGYVLVTQSRPSRSQHQQLGGPTCRTWSDHDHSWWCRRLGLPDAATERLWQRRHQTTPRWHAVELQAIGSLPTLTECWASPCIATRTNTHAHTGHGWQMASKKLGLEGFKKPFRKSQSPYFRYFN